MYIHYSSIQQNPASMPPKQSKQAPQRAPSRSFRQPAPPIPSEEVSNEQLDSFRTCNYCQARVHLSQLVDHIGAHEKEQERKERVQRKRKRQSKAGDRFLAWKDYRPRPTRSKKKPARQAEPEGNKTKKIKKPRRLRRNLQFELLLRESREIVGSGQLPRRTQRKRYAPQPRQRRQASRIDQSANNFEGRDVGARMEEQNGERIVERECNLSPRYSMMQPQSPARPQVSDPQNEEEEYHSYFSQNEESRIHRKYKEKRRNYRRRLSEKDKEIQGLTQRLQNSVAMNRTLMNNLAQLQAQIRELEEAAARREASDRNGDNQANNNNSSDNSHNNSRGSGQERRQSRRHAPMSPYSNPNPNPSPSPLPTRIQSNGPEPQQVEVKLEETSVWDDANRIRLTSFRPMDGQNYDRISQPSLLRPRESVYYISRDNEENQRNEEESEHLSQEFVPDSQHDYVKKEED